MKLHPAVLFSFIGLALLSCRTPTPTLVGGNLGSSEFDLRRLEKSGFSRAWMRPDVSIAGYDGVHLTFPDLRYRTPPRYSSKGAFGMDNYSLSEGFTRELMSALEQSFRNELASASGWRPTTEPNADPTQRVLGIQVSLVDLIIHVPLELPGGDTMVWTRSIGAVTVVIDLYDATTDRFLARFAERRFISPLSRRPIRANPGPALYEARQIFLSWARNLRLALEAIGTAEASLPSPASSD